MLFCIYTSFKLTSKLQIILNLIELFLSVWNELQVAKDLFRHSTVKNSALYCP